MKKLLLTFSILASITQTYAQVVFNRAYHDVSEVANPFLLAIHGDIYYTSSRYATHSASSLLYKHTGIGTLKHLGSIGENTVKQMLTSNDNKVIISGILNYCDTPPMIQENYLRKLDTNGVTIFSTTYTINEGDSPRACLHYSDSTYFTFTDNLLFKHSKTGQFISKTNLGINEISSALELVNGSLLISAKQNSINALVILSSSGVITSTTSFPILLNKMVIYGVNQKLMGLGTDGKIYKISPSFSLIGSSSFPNSAFVNDFVCQSDTIYSIHSTINALSNYRMCDTSFTDISLSSTSTNSMTQNAICLSNNNKVNILAIGVAGNSSWNNFKHYFVSLSHLNKFASNNFQHDLKVLSVNADSTYTSCYPAIFQPGTNICTPYLRAKVLVKNVGTTTITDFKLNSFQVPAIDCGISYYQETISNLNLIPGDSITVITSGFAHSWNSPFTTTSFTTEFCFYTSIPNSETDKTVEDNVACNSFNFLVTSLNENSKLEQFINIAPNPFNIEIMIEADSEISVVSVYNTLGQVIKTQEGNDKKISLDNSDLQNGIYFLHIETEKGTVIKKVLKN
jgi:hypothetical protein